ncbi:MAG: putative acetyltransferase [Pseudohongiellaceae bacterium]|jgi:putative acetyltransferase
MSHAEPPFTPLGAQIRDLRYSSRRLVRALGVMDTQVEGLSCTPPQCHEFIELAARGQLSTGELAELLEVDKSTASRTLRPLLQQGLLSAEADPFDQRIKPLSLTDAGRAKVQAIHAVADEQVRRALCLLSDDDRAVVLAGVSLYERALHKAKAKALAGVAVRPIEPQDDTAMAHIIRTVMTEFDAVGCGTSIHDSEVDAMSAAYTGERKAYFVAERDGQVMGGGGIAPLQGSDSPDVCELRKMHALPSARGLGIGRQLLERCLGAAREAGFDACYLETMQHMHQARALYEKVGFQMIDRPMGNTGHTSCDGWYALEL